MKTQKLLNKRALALIGMLALLFLPVLVSAAVDFSKAVSTEDQATFDQILQPVMKIYNLVKYFASALAGVALLATGAVYMTSGADPKKRDNAKSMAMYVIIGLLIIWAAPLMVGLLAG